MACCLRAASHNLNQCWHIVNLDSQECISVKIYPKIKTMHLTHWGRVTQICVGRLTIIGSYNGLSPGRRQAIIWTNAEILFIGPLGTKFSEILIEIHTFSFKKIHLKMSSAKWRPFCLGLKVLKICKMWAILVEAQCVSYATIESVIKIQRVVLQKGVTLALNNSGGWTPYFTIIYSILNTYLGAFR